MPIEDREIVLAYRGAESIHDVMAALDEAGYSLSMATVYARARRLRKAGVNLPEVMSSRALPRPDVAELNRLLEEGED